MFDIAQLFKAVYVLMLHDSSRTGVTLIKGECNVFTDTYEN